MSIEKERKAFEEKFKIPAHWISYDNFTNKYYCKYNLTDDAAIKYQARWEAWKASANREGYKLVPVDSLKEIIECAYCHIHDRCVGDEGDDVVNHILAMGVEDED